jgi:hypothetical protein
LDTVRNLGRTTEVDPRVAELAAEQFMNSQLGDKILATLVAQKTKGQTPVGCNAVYRAIQNYESAQASEQLNANRYGSTKAWSVACAGQQLANAVRKYIEFPDEYKDNDIISAVVLVKERVHANTQSVGFNPLVGCCTPLQKIKLMEVPGEQIRVAGQRDSNEITF